MAEKTVSEGRSSPRRAVTALAVLLVLTGAAACSSSSPKTQVKGEVISKDPNLGGPDPAVSQFRAGQGTSYGTGPRPLR
jgi:hypothetical protein